MGFTLRFTTRQGIQLHGVLFGDLKTTIAGINTCLLTTLGACGDVNRNVMTSPAPRRNDPVQAELERTARQLAAHFAPRSGAYHEIWLNGERQGNGAAAEVEEPLYGKTYLRLAVVRPLSVPFLFTFAVGEAERALRPMAERCQWSAGPSISDAGR